MIAKILSLYIISLLFISCASQGLASGGPADKEGPILVSVQPRNETLLIGPSQKITLSFNELLDPVSIPTSISLAEEYKVRAVPTIVVEENGIVIDRIIGVITKQQILERLM